MSLADACSDLMPKIADALVNNTSMGGYDEKAVVEVIDALYSIATATSGHDTHGTPNVNVELGINRVVLGALFEAKIQHGKRTQQTNSIIDQLLADVSKWHSRLSAGLNAIDAEIAANPNSIITKMNPGIGAFIKNIINLQ